MRATRFLCAALVVAAAVFGAGAARSAGATDFVLHPGYIDGTVSIPGWALAPMNTAGAGSSPGSVVARGRDASGQEYRAEAYISPSGTYHLTVEGGEWEYEISIGVNLSGSAPGLAGTLEVARRVTVAPGQTVVVDVQTDSTIDVNLDLAGLAHGSWTVGVGAAADVPSTSPAYGFFFGGTNAGTDEFPVPVLAGQDCAYRVTSAEIQFPEMGASLQLRDGNGTVVVPGGGATSWAIAPQLSYLEGTVTGSGGTLASGGVSGWSGPTIPGWTGPASFSCGFGSGGTYRMPVPADSLLQIACLGTFTNGTQAQAGQYLGGLAPGATQVLDFTLEAPTTGSLAGTIQVGGVDPVTTISHGYGRVADLPEGSYRIDLIPPTPSWSEGTVQCWHDNLLTLDDGVTTIAQTYRWPRTSARIVAGQTTTRDFQFDAGFLEGNILAPGSLGAGDMRGHTVLFETPSTFNTQESAETGLYDSAGTRPADANYPRAFVRPGMWRVKYLWARIFTRRNYPGTTWGALNTDLNVNFLDGSPWAPFVQVGSGEHVAPDLNLRLAKLILRLRVDGGARISGPAAWAYWVSGLDGTDGGIRCQASASGEDGTEPSITLYVLPGTHDIEASGVVNGSRTTFGRGRVTVGVDDVLELDLTGPTILVDTPPAGFETRDGGVTVTGTVTDASGVATLTVNGAAVPFDAATGAFTWDVSGLVRGANALVVQATDTSGNTSTLTRTIYRTNTDPVAVIASAGLSYEWGSLVVLDASGSSDPDGDALTYAWSLDGEPVGEEALLSVPAGLGEHRVDLVVTDAYGAMATATATVSVVDTTGPAFTYVPPDVTLELTEPDGAPYCLDAAQAEDSTGLPVLLEPAEGVSGTFPLGTTTVLWTATDAFGNTATAETRVIVVDRTPPSIGAPALLVLELAGAEGTPYVLSAPAVYDASGTATLTPGEVQANFPLGETTVTYEATDGSGNVASATTVVRVVDTTPPTLSVVESLVVELDSPAGTALTLPQANTSDFGGAVTVSNDAPAVFPFGTTTVTWTATDASGNAATATTMVTVLDHTSPVLIPPAPVTLELASTSGTPYVLPPPTVTDASGAVTWTSDAPALFPVGATTVHYTATDASGNTTTASTVVTVVDTTPPVVVDLRTSPGELWPPDHKMVDVSVSVFAADATGWSARIVGLASSEPEIGSGSGDKYPDMKVTGLLTCQLRAERCGTETGRVYTITVEVTDPAGNKTLAEVDLPVDHDLGGGNVWRTKPVPRR